MKKLSLLFLFSSCFIFSIAQSNKLKIIPFYDYDSSDIYGVMNLLNIEILKYKLSKEFYHHKINLVIDEYTKGKKKEIFNSVGSIPSMYINVDVLDDSSNREDFELRFYIRKTDTILKLYSRYGKAGLEHYLALKRGKQYSYKDVHNLDSSNYKIDLGKKFPVWTYTQPVAKKSQKRQYGNNDNVAEFCGVGSGQVPFEEWYKKLGIEHFFIFSIITDNPKL